MNVLVRSENMSNTALGDVTSPLSIIDIRSLTKTYDEKAGPVIDNVSLQIEKGTIHGIIGRSGAGKYAGPLPERTGASKRWESLCFGP